MAHEKSDQGSSGCCSQGPRFVADRRNKPGYSCDSTSQDLNLPDNNSIYKTITAFLPAAVWAIVVIILSIIPVAIARSAFKSSVVFVKLVRKLTFLAPLRFSISSSVRHMDKIIHFFEYAVLVMVVGYCIGYFTKWAMKKSLPISFVLCTGYGCAMEYLQNFIPGRTAGVDDIFANTAGAVFGVISMFLIVGSLRVSRVMRAQKKPVMLRRSSDKNDLFMNIAARMFFSYQTGISAGKTRPESDPDTYIT